MTGEALVVSGQRGAVHPVLLEHGPRGEQLPEAIREAVRDGNGWRGERA